jgi:hypothetical protein
MNNNYLAQAHKNMYFYPLNDNNRQAVARLFDDVVAGRPSKLVFLCIFCN